MFDRAIIINVFEGANIFTNLEFPFIIGKFRFVVCKMSVETGVFGRRFLRNANFRSNKTNRLELKFELFELSWDAEVKVVAGVDKHEATRVPGECLEMRLEKNELMAFERD